MVKYEISIGNWKSKLHVQKKNSIKLNMYSKKKKRKKEIETNKVDNLPKLYNMQ